MKTDERLYLNADKSMVVPDGDPDAAYLLASAGSDVPHEFESLVREYQARTNEKAVKPSSNKAVKPSEDK